MRQYDSQVLLRALGEAGSWPHPVGDIRLVETHISWILLTGDFAYKLKRPLDLGFLDFTTLEKRRDACLEELRLNRRTAPELYVDVVAICGDPARPRIEKHSDEPDDVFEYAVRMHEFDQEDQLDQQLAAGELECENMVELAGHVAGFHGSIPRATADDPWDGVDRLRRLARENFEVLEPLVDDTADRETLGRLRDWTRQELESLSRRIEQRLADGFVREGHGDLHLSNITRFRGRYVAFDCIEFDPSLRWMDVMCEAGFLVMDLAARHRVDLAWAFLNRYLELSGDYDGTSLLRFYIVYASMVRSKIAGIRAEQDQPGSQTYSEQARQYRMHLALAERATRPRRPLLLLTHGYSGAGKSFITQRLANALPAIRVRSDLERKRLHGISPQDNTGADPGRGIYDPSASNELYRHLRDCAGAVLAGHFDVIVDASFLTHAHRTLFFDLARDTRAELVILNCRAEDKVLRSRIRQRSGDASDADIEVLNYQQQHADPFTELEKHYVVTVDTNDETDPLRVTGAICSRLGRENVD